jgi:membrane protein DedA with SNARE-associated domain
LIKAVLLSSHGLVAYGTVFGILLACGLGVPLPEDVSLVLGGYLAHHGAAELPIMIGIAFAGIVLGDSMIFYAGRRIGSRVGQKQGFLSRVVTPEKRARVEGLFAAHGQKIVMAARFLPGVRAVTFFTAGSAGMGYGRFVLWDGLAALISAPFFVWLGFHFGEDLDSLISNIKHGQMTVVASLSVVILALLGVRYVRNRRAASLSPARERVAEGSPLTPDPSPRPGRGEISPDRRGA